MPSPCIGVAATVRVGLAFGRGDTEGIRRAGWTALATGAAFTTCSCILFLSAAPWVVSLFLDPVSDAHAAALAVGFLVVAGVFQLVDGGQVIAANALRGLSDTRMPMIIAICGYWLLGLPVAYGLGFVAGWRGLGIWIGLAAGLAAVACVLVARFAMRDRLGLTSRRPA
jgi:MATE family multidrug resistance protein